ncbi:MULTISPECIES: hypothetical protein [unclassified Nocardioides]|uniref:hypothetical protein n=1 Tax=unclassified Nocardioides TaxID=2615069 RepID=UPI003014E367
MPLVAWCAVMGYGFFRAQLVWDPAEACGLRGQTYDPDYVAAHDPPWWAFRNPCNAGHDLVAGWVTPTAWALAVLTLLGLAVLVSARLRSWRP